MFKGTSITRSPVIYAGSPGSYGMSQMFNGCSALTSITTNLTTWTSNGTKNWVTGVSAAGDFYCPDTLDVSVTSVSRVPTGWTVKTRLTTLKFTAAPGGATVGISAYEDGETAPSISMLSSTDGLTWGNYSVGNAIALQGGESV